MSDLISRQFGRLTVMDFEGIHTTPCGTRRKMWRCRCECGNESVVAENNLKNGTTKSCGCWKYEKLKERNTIHGGSNDRLYRIWKNMKRRCDSPNDKRYKTYGGKGVKVCEEWSNNYQSFKEWAYANGYDDSAEFQKCTLDRVDNDGDYEPNNCRWATMKEQANNKRTNRIVVYNGCKYTLTQLAEKIGMNKTTLKERLNMGWSVEDAVNRPIRLRTKGWRKSNCARMDAE